MIARDDHDSALNADPQLRHHLRIHFKKNITYQSTRTNHRMMHNHPSGDPTPSHADIDMTKEIIEAGKRLGIAVHDHLIIGKKGYASMKGLLLI